MCIEDKIIEKLEHGKNREYSLSCRDTVVIKTVDGVREATYILWCSPIVTIKDVDGKKKIVFSFCGWSSMTTKNRISAILWHFLGWSIFQKNWKIYITKSLKVYPVDCSMQYTVNESGIVDVHGKELEEIKDFK